jgi:hypothetical protein
VVGPIRLLVPGGLITAGLLMASPAAGQRPNSGPPALTWGLDTLRSGFCIHFLVDPAASPGRLFRGVARRPASATPLLHPAIRRTIEASPELAAWVPQRFCVLQFSAIRVGDRELRDLKHGRPQVIATWSTSAEPDASGSVVLLVNSSRLANSLKSIGMHVDGIRCAFGKAPGSSDDRYQIRYDRTTLVWDGRTTGDSTAAPAMMPGWVARGRGGRLLSVEPQRDPAGARLMVGALRIVGKGELARALAASPIRYVGPIIWGGSGRMTFAAR